MTDYKKYFKGKKITIMGLGLLGRGVNVAKFLASCGAELTITDLKTRRELKSSLDELKKYKNIKYTLGKHDLRDFADKDMIIKAAGVPLDSSFIKEAKKNDIPVEMDASLFAKLAPDVEIVGITGTRGKSLTTALIYEILSKSSKYKNKVHLGGNVRGLATLPLLAKVKKGHILVAELDSWQLQGFGDSEISPKYSVFTSFMQDHMNYYKDSMQYYLKDKANIFKYQKKGDVLVIGPEVKRFIVSSLESKLVIASPEEVEGYDFIVPGKHSRANLACAVAITKAMGVKITEIKKAISGFTGLEGRLQLVKDYKGVKIYNDNNATTPAATVAGVLALSKVTYKDKPKLILIAGGNDKRLSLHKLVRVLNKNCKEIVLMPGTGTDRLVNHKFKYKKAKDLKSAFEKALDLAYAGDTILFSPAFSSFSQFNNEYERNDLFMELVNKLK